VSWAITPGQVDPDALHVAFALSLGADETTVVTHDEEIAAACTALGLSVIDPVADDSLHRQV